jgi:hypothetical protein
MEAKLGTVMQAMFLDMYRDGNPLLRVKVSGDGENPSSHFSRLERGISDAVKKQPYGNFPIFMGMDRKCFERTEL